MLFQRGKGGLKFTLEKESEKVLEISQPIVVEPKCTATTKLNSRDMGEGERENVITRRFPHPTVFEGGGSI